MSDDAFWRAVNALTVEFVCIDAAEQMIEREQIAPKVREILARTDAVGASELERTVLSARRAVANVLIALGDGRAGYHWKPEGA